MDGAFRPVTVRKAMWEKRLQLSSPMEKSNSRKAFSILRVCRRCSTGGTVGPSVPGRHRR